MEATYGIGITNRYALFLEEGEDALDVLKEKPKPKTEKSAEPAGNKSGKPAEAKGKPAQPQPKKPTTAPLKETQANVIKPATEQNKPREDGYRPGLGPRPPRGDRGGRFPTNNPREERNNRRNDERPRDFGSVTNTEGGLPVGGSEERPRAPFRGGFRGDRGGRGMRGGRGRGGAQDTRGKRDFDRQSGSDKTSVKPVEKREGSGAHNWGSVQDEIEGQLEPAVVEEVAEGETEVAVNAEAPTEAKEGEETPVVAAEDDEAKELTLDEWRALRGERKKPEFNIRKPGEGEDNTQWKKTFVLDKKKDEEEDEDEIIDLTAEYPQRAGRQKRLDIDIRFSDSRRGSGAERGGRGRGRGRGEGSFRGDREERGGYRGGFRGEGEQRGGFRGERDVEGGGGYRGGFRGDRGEEQQREFRGGFRGGDREERGRGGYRGGRGGPRGGSGGAPAGNRGPAQPSAPKVDDEKDFPALG